MRGIKGRVQKLFKGYRQLYGEERGIQGRDSEVVTGYGLKVQWNESHP